MTQTITPESTHSISTLQPLPPPVAFSVDEDIDYAFTKLSTTVTDVIQHTNFDHLQRACIERARSPKMIYKSNEIIPVINYIQC